MMACTRVHVVCACVSEFVCIQCSGGQLCRKVLYQLKSRTVFSHQDIPKKTNTVVWQMGTDVSMFPSRHQHMVLNTA